MNKDKIKTIFKAQNSFRVFVTDIFSQSKSLFQNGFIGGEYVNTICDFFQNNKKTARVSARDHFKSTAFYAHFMWHLLRDWDKNLEGHYFSYQYQMAAYHIGKIKQAIKSNEYFAELKDKKSTAESVVSYTWDNKHFTTLEPHGLLEFKRGIHAPLIYVDDPFQDPANKMVITIIKKINDIFKGQILDMVQDEIHVCGTPQTNEDFFFNKDLMGRFKVMVTPAIKDEINKVTLWPEWMGWEELQQRRRERGDKMFNQEYLCSPTYAEEAFIKRDVLYSLVNSKLVDVGIAKAQEIKNDVVAGFDIGKKTHPSHLAVFELVKGKRRQIHQIFMDGWDYIRQIEYLREAIEKLKIDKLYYDDTRGEFESFKESGQLPIQMEGVVFSVKTKNALAAHLDKAITSKEIEFLNHKRMLDQMLLVTNDLEAIETPEGHGDSFWSVALTFKYEENPMPEITII